VEQVCSKIAVHRTVNDHTSYMIRVRTKIKMDGSEDFKTPTRYPNVGDYKGWTGLSPPSAYPSTGGTVISEGSRVRRHHACVQRNYSYPSGL
jgi:hypothetical protein